MAIAYLATQRLAAGLLWLPQYMAEAAHCQRRAGWPLFEEWQMNRSRCILALSATTRQCPVPGGGCLSTVHRVMA